MACCLLVKAATGGMCRPATVPDILAKEARMHDIDAVVSDLEWRRVRRRLTMPHAFASLCNIVAGLIIFVLRHSPPALTR